MELELKINKLSELLDKAIKELKNTGKDYAEAYTSYRIALAKELLKLKDEGMAITLAGDIARGKPEIARLKFNEISKEAIYKANLESINATKLRIKIIEEQIQRDYSLRENN